MPYENGVSGNPHGRPKGAANKATAAARETIAAVLAGADAEKLAAQLNKLTGKDYIDAFVKLAEFVTPKLQRTALQPEKEDRVNEITTTIIYAPSRPRSDSL
jgi:chorismate synthase